MRFCNSPFALQAVLYGDVVILGGLDGRSFTACLAWLYSAARADCHVLPALDDAGADGGALGRAFVLGIRAVATSAANPVQDGASCLGIARGGEEIQVAFADGQKVADSELGGRRLWP